MWGGLFEIFQEDITSDNVAPGRWRHQEPDIVVRDPVPADPVRGVFGDRRVVEVKADTIAEHEVPFDRRPVRLLERQTVAGRAAVVEEDIAAHRLACAVHEVDADRVVAQEIAVDRTVVRVHNVHSVPAPLDDIAADEGAVGVPDEDVATLLDVVVEQAGAWAVPEFDTVAALRFG
ncbi:hypothetical protein HRbin27_00463 [bacterium HR27]|nr:hypothetical protein HRbin27_00463 [bacterium HR27]